MSDRAILFSTVQGQAQKFYTSPSCIRTSVQLNSNATNTRDLPYCCWGEGVMFMCLMGLMIERDICCSIPVGYTAAKDRYKEGSYQYMCILCWFCWVLHSLTSAQVLHSLQIYLWTIWMLNVEINCHLAATLKLKFCQYYRQVCMCGLIPLETRSFGQVEGVEVMRGNSNWQWSLVFCGIP